MTTTSPNTDGQPLTWAVDEALPEDPRREDIDGSMVVSPSPTGRHLLDGPAAWVP